MLEEGTQGSLGKMAKMAKVVYNSKVKFFLNILSGGTPGARAS